MEEKVLTYEQLIRMNGNYVKVVAKGKEELNPLKLRVSVDDSKGYFINLKSNDEVHAYGFPNGDLINKGTWIDIYKIS